MVYGVYSISTALKAKHDQLVACCGCQLNLVGVFSALRTRLPSSARHPIGLMLPPLIFCLFVPRFMTPLAAAPSLWQAAGGLRCGVDVRALKYAGQELVLKTAAKDNMAARRVMRLLVLNGSPPQHCDAKPFRSVSVRSLLP